MKLENLRVLLFALFLVQPIFLFAQNSLNFSVQCVGKDSIQVDVRNIGKGKTCFHVPGGGFSFAVGSPDEFSPLMKIGPKDYKEQCEYLQGLQSVFVEHCKKD